jgi:site-specific DNA recombinase
MKQAVLYLRVSTDEQAKKGSDPEGYSIPAQREACLRKAQQMEVAVVDEYRDAGESARSADRPQLQAMLARIEQRSDVAYVIVHKVDRLARNRYDDVTINLRLRQAGATLVSVSESIDDSPPGQLLHAIMAANAEFFSRNLATETLKGLSQKFKAGGTIGLAPIGYLNALARIEGREIRTIEVDPDRAPLVQWAFERYATGRYSLDRLLYELTKRGLTTRATAKRPSQPLSRSSLARMLQNRYYMGRVRYKGAEGPGTHPPLISEGLFAKVAAVLKAHALSGEKLRVHPHYLRGSVFCDPCHSRLCLTHAKRRYYYFFCIGRQRRNGCALPYLSADDLEESVADRYRTLQLTDNELAQVRAELSRYLRRRRKILMREAERCRRRIPRLDAERTKLLQAHLADAVPLDVLSREQARLTAEISHAEGVIKASEAKAEDEERVIEQAIDLMANWEDTYRRADPNIRRRLNQVFFTKLLVGVDGEVANHEWSPSYEGLRAPNLRERLDSELSALENEAPNPDLLFAGQGSNNDHKG